jgi:hypothetical protein
LIANLEKYFNIGSVLRVMSSVVLGIEIGSKFAVALKFDYWSISIDNSCGLLRVFLIISLEDKYCLKVF